MPIIKLRYPSNFKQESDKNFAGLKTLAELEQDIKNLTDEFNLFRSIVADFVKDLPNAVLAQINFELEKRGVLK